MDSSTSGIGHYPVAGNYDYAECSPCQSDCGPECASGCHQCARSRKSMLAKFKDYLYNKKKPVTGFCVEEVQYGANAGYPSYGYNSHGAWWSGTAYGPGHGKVAMLKAQMAQRKHIRQSNRQARCDCQSCQKQTACCGSCEAGCQNGDCALPSMGYDIGVDQPMGGEELESYPLFDGPPATTPNAAPTPKTNEGSATKLKKPAARGK